MKYSGLYTFDKDTHKYVPITSIKEIWDIEEDDDVRFHRPHPHNPLTDGWICPYCGKRVYSMEVHPCNQPWCGGKFMYEESHPEDGPFCWNYGGKNGERG